MGLFSFEKPKDNQEKKEKNSLLFEIKKRIRSYEFSVGIERGDEPARGKVDFINKKIDLRVTPEGINRGAEAVLNFLNSPRFQTEMDSLIKILKEGSEERKSEKEREAVENVKQYPVQEGKKEAETIKEIIEIFEEKK